LKTRRNGNLTNQTADFMGNHRDIMEIFHGDMEKSSGLSRGKRWEIPEPNGDSSISRLDYHMLWVYLKIECLDFLPWINSSFSPFSPFSPSFDDRLLKL